MKEGYRDIKCTISFDIEFRLDTSEILSEIELISAVQTMKELINKEVEKSLIRMDCTILN